MFQPFAINPARHKKQTHDPCDVGKKIHEASSPVTAYTINGDKTYSGIGSGRATAEDLYMHIIPKLIFLHLFTYIYLPIYRFLNVPTKVICK